MLSDDVVLAVADPVAYVSQFMIAVPSTPTTMNKKRRSTTRLAVALALAFAVNACGHAATVTTTPPVAPAALGANQVVPAPVSVVPDTGAPFALTAATVVVVRSANGEAVRVGEALATLLRPPTGFRIPVAPPAGAVVTPAVEQAGWDEMSQIREEVSLPKAASSSEASW